MLLGHRADAAGRLASTLGADRVGGDQRIGGRRLGRGGSGGRGCGGWPAAGAGAGAAGAAAGGRAGGRPAGCQCRGGGGGLERGGGRGVSGGGGVSGRRGRPRGGGPPGAGWPRRLRPRRRARGRRREPGRPAARSLPRRLPSGCGWPPPGLPACAGIQPGGPHPAAARSAVRHRPRSGPRPAAPPGRRLGRGGRGGQAGEQQEKHRGKQPAPCGAAWSGRSHGGGATAWRPAGQAFPSSCYRRVAQACRSAAIRAASAHMPVTRHRCPPQTPGPSIWVVMLALMGTHLAGMGAFLTLPVLAPLISAETGLPASLAGGSRRWSMAGRWSPARWPRPGCAGMAASGYLSRGRCWSSRSPSRWRPSGIPGALACPVLGGLGHGPLGPAGSRWRIAAR